MSNDWRPSASLAPLRQRASLLQATRQFFATRQVLEVQTPVAVRHAVTDAQLSSFALNTQPARFLHTSPEYAMKRLLAAGSGDIWQMTQVFRNDERSALHNPEFTMVEWYRLGFDLERIALETCELINALLICAGQSARSIQSLRYADALKPMLGDDPLACDVASLRAVSIEAGLAASSAHTATRDDLLDFLIAVHIGPQLGRGNLTWLHHYPASQAALAQLDANDPRTALRFEVYADGIELANGFVELARSEEQRQRFNADLAERQRRGLPTPAIDESLLSALDAGLPACAGVALGFDRAVMLALRAPRIEDVIAFDWDHS
ncbi:MAG: EF-P lysine aminoacylase GenX [Nevskiaceae bacterium]|nr:EF-P lysine aminoacylase GenX [Nevskiaceae bacterium]